MLKVVKILKQTSTPGSGEVILECVVGVLYDGRFLTESPPVFFTARSDTLNLREWTDADLTDLVRRATFGPVDPADPDGAQVTPFLAHTVVGMDLQPLPVPAP